MTLRNFNIFIDQVFLQTNQPTKLMIIILMIFSFNVLDLNGYGSEKNRGY